MRILGIAVLLAFQQLQCMESTIIQQQDVVKEKEKNAIIALMHRYETNETFATSLQNVLKTITDTSRPCKATEKDGFFTWYKALKKHQRSIIHDALLNNEQLRDSDIPGKAFEIANKCLLRFNVSSLTNAYPTFHKDLASPRFINLRNHTLLQACACKKVNTTDRVVCTLKILSTIFKNHPHDAPLVITSFGAGQYLQEYILAGLIARYGYRLQMNLIEDDSAAAKWGSSSTVKPETIFMSAPWIKDCSVSATKFKSTSGYLKKCSQNPDLYKPHLALAIDVGLHELFDPNELHNELHKTVHISVILDDISIHFSIYPQGRIRAFASQQTKEIIDTIKKVTAMVQQIDHKYTIQEAVQLIIVHIADVFNNAAIRIADDPHCEFYELTKKAQRSDHTTQALALTLHRIFEWNPETTTDQDFLSPFDVSNLKKFDSKYTIMSEILDEPLAPSSIFSRELIPQ